MTTRNEITVNDIPWDTAPAWAEAVVYDTHDNELAWVSDITLGSSIRWLRDKLNYLPVGELNRTWRLVLYEIKPD